MMLLLVCLMMMISISSQSQFTLTLQLHSSQIRLHDVCCTCCGSETGAVFYIPVTSLQTPAARSSQGRLDFLFFFFQSKNFTCFCTLSSAASITQGCTGSARSTAVTTTQSAACTAEKQLKSYLVVKWKTLAAFGQWCIFHCVQQLMFTTSAETLSIYWPFCQTGQRDETP